MRITTKLMLQIATELIQRSALTLPLGCQKQSIKFRETPFRIYSKNRTLFPAFSFLLAVKNSNYFVERTKNAKRHSLCPKSIRDEHH